MVARTLAQQLNFAIEQATSPFQFALIAKSGCDCVAHIAQALTDIDVKATLLSVDGIGAFAKSPGVPCSKGVLRLSDSSTVPHQLVGGTMTRSHIRNRNFSGFSSLTVTAGVDLTSSTIGDWKLLVG